MRAAFNGKHAPIQALHRVSHRSQGVEVMEITGIAGLLILIADIWAILRIVGSGADPLEKLIWVVVVLIFPLIGVIVWYLIGPGGGKARPV